MNQYRKQLEPKPNNWGNKKWQGRKAGSYQWYEIQDNIAYYKEFEKSKIIYPVIAKQPRFAFDTVGSFINDKCFIIPVNDLYLLAILNSLSMWKYLNVFCSDLGQGIELRSIYMNKLPIPPATEEQKSAISKLAQKCIDAKGVNCEKWEQEIDEIVAGLYGL